MKEREEASDEVKVALSPHDKPAWISVGHLQKYCVDNSTGRRSPRSGLGRSRTSGRYRYEKGGLVARLKDEKHLSYCESLTDTSQFAAPSTRVHKKEVKVDLICSLKFT